MPDIFHQGEGAYKIVYSNDRTSFLHPRGAKYIVNLGMALSDEKRMEEIAGKLGLTLHELKSKLNEVESLHFEE